jgi:cobalamin biosynthesis Mg chelatase CobN
LTDRFSTDEDGPDPDQDSEQPSSYDVSPLSIQEIGSASRSCLVIIVLIVVILLLVCLSWLFRLLF